MNIVKGVADLLRRSSGGQAGESPPWGRSDRFSAPSTRIHFRDAGEEAVLHSLWQKYESCIDKTEKRKLLQIFLMQFIQTYENWEPDKDFSLEIYPQEDNYGFPEVILGCSDGHPSEVILILIQELVRITSVVTEMNREPAEQSGDPDSANFNVEVLRILSSLEIIIRSVHNCRVFSYYGGVQKVVALLKATVVHLKTLISALGGDEHLSNSGVEKASVLQKILLYVISIIFSFTNLNFNAYGRILYVNNIQNYFSTDRDFEKPTKNSEGSMTEASVNWQQKATVMVLEAGGLNWLVELLRVTRRLNLKERGTVLSLHYLTLGTLRSALLQNPRSQNHFRLIGGLEVLLDGLGLPSSNCLTSKAEFLSHSVICGSHMFSIFQLQILSLEVLRESIFGNMNNLLFLCENGRVQKFANSLCWPSFLFQEFTMWVKESDPVESPDVVHSEKHVSLGCSFQSEWNLYVIKLSRAFCSFLLPPDNIKFDDVSISSAQTLMPVSMAYWEDSSRWMVKVLFAVFPCIKACSTENELPYHLRIFASTLQKHILYVFRKVIVSAPGLLDAFREEGIWNLIFSENFFYFVPLQGEASMDIRSSPEEGMLMQDPACSLMSSVKYGQENVDIFHMEVISFVEFTATLNGNKHNMPECASLLDALERSACNPQIAIILLRSLHRILQLAFEQTVASFAALDAVSRILKVACIEAEEHGKINKFLKDKIVMGSVDSKCGENNSDAEVPGELLMNCMEASLQLFSEYLLTADDGKILVIQNAHCIESLFDLFWVESLRSRILGQVLSLMKTPSSSAEAHAGKLHLCSKYLETFTRIKEKEKRFSELSIDLLAGMRNVILTDRAYFQTLFCEGECFLHIISLLNESVDEEAGEQLVLNVLETLTSLLCGNAVSKVVFRGLVGVGYQMMQSLLLDFFQFHPSMNLLNALLDMLVDGKFDAKEIQKIKNEDVIILFLNILRKSSDSLRHYGLGIFQTLLRDSVPNRTSCCRAGMLSVLLDWFLHEEDGVMITMIAQLIQVTGGHSVTGKDLRKFFALLRNEKIRSKQNCYSLLLDSIGTMLREKGPTAFFEFSGFNSGIMIKTPVQVSYSKGFSFTCWIRIETFPAGNMGLFCFLTNSGRGCLAMLGRDKLIFESINQKKQSISLPITMVSKRWHFLCITHIVGRAFSGGSIVKCYIDGVLLSSEKCRYPKVSENLMYCTIGIKPIDHFEDNSQPSIEESFPFIGQMGPAYMFGDALSQDQVKGIYFLGPNYMYSFSPNEFSSNIRGNGALDPKDGLSSKIIFGLNAQASDGKVLFNACSSSDHILNGKIFEAEVIDGTQICSRRMLQEIIYCVGGVSVFFPLLVQLGITEAAYEELDLLPVQNDGRDKLAADVLDLITSVLDDNLANQQQMQLLSGFSILGFLFQSVSPKQLNMHTFLSLRRMLDVLKGSGKSELVSDAISWIHLNSYIWVLAEFNVQRELYMLLVHYFENDSSLLLKLCGFPWVLDTICQFYCENLNSSSFFATPRSHLSTKILSERRLTLDEVHKIRLLLLSLAEMSLRQKVSVIDIKALVSFLERSQDLACIEDVLHMVIRLLSQKVLLTSFLEQVDLLGGCQIFISLLHRDSEPIRLLALQFLGELLVGLPSDKKGAKFFSISVGRPKSLLESDRKEGNVRLQTILSLIGERLFKFPLSDNLSATLFDVLLGGASPKQILQKHGQVQISKADVTCLSSHFIFPHIMVLIFKFLAHCKDCNARGKILRDLLDLLHTNPSNVEALMEIGWSSWLETSVKLYASEKLGIDWNENEQMLVRSVYCVVLSHCTFSVRGGWHQLEETVNYILFSFRNGKLPNNLLLQHIFEDLVACLIEATREENILLAQPCRDNTLYLLKLLDEMLMNENSDQLPFPAGGFCTVIPFRSQESGSWNDVTLAIEEILKTEGVHQIPRIAWNNESSPGIIDDAHHCDRWNLYENVCTIIGEMSGKTSNKTLVKGPVPGGPSLGQRARDLVESLNIPATEMAAAVSGGIGSAFGGRTNKTPDKAMLLRSEKCPRIIFHLVVFYLCRGSSEKASAAVQKFCSLLPNLLSSEEEQFKNRFQLFLWSLVNLRSLYEKVNNEARARRTTQLIFEIVNCWKSVLSASNTGVDDVINALTNLKEQTSVLGVLQKDRILGEVIDEMTYVKASNSERLKQLEDLHVKMGEASLAQSNQSKVLEDEVVVNMCRILASDDSRKAAFQLAHDEKQQMTAERWVHMLRSLIDERGPWSANPFPSDSITRWKLDKTEDNLRRRPKLRRNYHFDDTLCLPPTSNQLPPGHTVAESYTVTGAVPDQIKSFVRKEMYGTMGDGSLETGDDACETGRMSEFEMPDDRKHLNIVQDVTDSETNEVLLSIACVLVIPKRKLFGRLAVMRNALHFFSEFLVEGTGGSSIFKHFSGSNAADYAKQEQLDGSLKRKVHKGIPCLDSDLVKDPSAGATDLSSILENQRKKIKRHRRWNICKVKAVHWSRYLLQYTALEIFFNDSVAPVFLNFASSSVAKEVGTLIVSSRNDALFPKGSSRDKSGLISLVDRRVANEMAETARESWRRREISNFEYLMILNTLSGRSYNDLTQYPIFPWVLADYSSEKLDFNKSSTFRDLSKPIGALDSKRFQVFEDRYHNFSDPDIPSFYYGSHYSSMGIVLFYLLRLEPFTALHRVLQGGKFDHADRLFQSIEGTYKNCLSNTSDVKELIPEFFYTTEFLVNSNSYHLGVKQDGELLYDVFLPPWAKGSPEEFIYQHREALESEYVSSNLHHWIDLIFGYKQRGRPAVEAANVFYYLTYEGAVDLETMDDELQRSAIEDQIANFGQTPIQLFRKKHPRRGPPIPIAHPLYFAPASISLTSIITHSSQLQSPVLFLDLIDSNIVVVNKGLVLSVKMWLTTQLQSGGNYTFSSAQEPSFGIGTDILSPRTIGTPPAENFQNGRQCFATVQTPFENYLISCGSWENSFQVISLQDGRTIQSVRQHKDVVSCVSVTSDGSVLATGSYDTTVMLWNVFQGRTNEKRVWTQQVDSPRKDQLIDDSPFHILCGHDDIITCLFVSTELDIVISGSKDATCIFHTLREGRYVRSIQHPSSCSLSRIVASGSGRVVIYAEEDLSLHLYSINGKRLASSESNGRLNCVELSGCGEFLVCAGDHGQITLRSLHSLEVVHRYDGIGKTLTSLVVSREECFLAGTRDGSLLVYSIENLQVRKNSYPKEIK